MRRLLPLFALALAPFLMALGVDILVLTNGDQIDFEAGPTHGFPRLAQEAAGGTAAECNEAGEVGQLIMDTTGAVNAKLEICTAAGWETVGNGSTGGDNVFENTSALTDADFTDSARISWSSDTAPAPDTISADVIADSVEDNQDLLDFQDDATADTCTATESADGSYLRRNTGDTAFECVQHWETHVVRWEVSNLTRIELQNAVALSQNLQVGTQAAEYSNNWNGGGERFPIPDTASYMHGFHKFPNGLDVVLDTLICCLQGDSLTATETVAVIPWWRRNNGTGGTANGGAATTMTVNLGTTAGRQDCTETTYNLLTPYPTQWSRLAIQLDTDTLTTGDDISIECTGFMRVSEN